PGQLVSTGEQTPIEVIAHATLSDASGHTIDNANSYVQVAILAWTGDRNMTMLESATVNNNQNISVPVPTSTPVLGLQPILSGFDLAYPSGGGDHSVRAVEVGISASLQNPGFASLGGTASMTDARGYYASTAIIAGSLLATSLSSPGF